MTSKTENGVQHNYAYDPNDRLISQDAFDYSYNGQGVRVRRDGLRSTTKFVVDINRELSQVLCETDFNGNITSYYVYGQGLAYKVLPDGRHFYYHFDALGSTVAITDDSRNVYNR